jgi:hypothetical protein
VLRPIKPDRVRKRAAEPPKHTEHRGGSTLLPGAVAAELARLRLEVWRLRRRLSDLDNGADDG